MTSSLRYRGISYDPRCHEQPSDLPVEHIYRGHHYNSSLHHAAAPVNTQAMLRYRGIAYHQQATHA